LTAFNELLQIPGGRRTSRDAQNDGWIALPLGAVRACLWFGRFIDFAKEIQGRLDLYARRLLTFGENHYPVGGGSQ
jgi:hypothetical protein